VAIAHTRLAVLFLALFTSVAFTQLSEVREPCCRSDYGCTLKECFGSACQVAVYLIRIGRTAHLPALHAWALGSTSTALAGMGCSSGGPPAGPRTAVPATLLLAFVCWISRPAHRRA